MLMDVANLTKGNLIFVGYETGNDVTTLNRILIYKILESHEILQFRDILKIPYCTQFIIIIDYLSQIAL